MRAICANSIPILKNNSDKKILLFAIPISIKALANPRPCKSPNPNAIIQGVLIFKSYLSISSARYTMVRAIKASTVPCGSATMLKTDNPSVML